ncbi:FliM/FliN family flagellar motor switch protein [Roseitranquillus sediminis]|uniref:FliM/FliN family flagellar motor switch protein n=1 Tax=Roseitranquillus sediminis TaxID=2809051 RepID=UPI001D0CB271|nr:flagellar motor switch protein FliM [Roseitranquillus sediminis]MBM9595683.1 FliM/FliN family flagellar motor switch protein [Roseitranquillus sediminis]
MVSDGALRAMRRKAGEGRPAPELGRMTTLRAWKIAVPQAADKAASLVAMTRSVTEERVVRDALVEDLPPGALLTLLEGPAERYGLAILDAQILGGLIEALTSGRVTARQAEPRKATATDAMLCADMLDALLEEFERSLSQMPEPPAYSGYRYAAPLVDARAATMTLAEGPYQVFRLELDLGGGAKCGALTVAFPVAPQSGATAPDQRAFSAAFQAQILGAPASVDAVLHRARVPIATVSEWQVGDVVPVPLSALAAVTLETAEGEVLATARLGQQGGFRAIRIVALGACEKRDGDEAFEDAAPATMRALPAAAGGSLDLSGEWSGDGVDADTDALPLDLDLGDFPPMQIADLPD